MQQQSRSERFVTFLQGLEESNDRGALAVLRRGLGRPPGEEPEMHKYVVRWADGEHPLGREHVLPDCFPFRLPSGAIEHGRCRAVQSRRLVCPVVGGRWYVPGRS